METGANPQSLFSLLFDFLKTGILKAAVDLELFTHIARGQRTAADVAHAAQADERGVRIVLDALCGEGLLTKAEGRYGLTPAVEMFLVKDSPAYAGSFTRITANPRIWQAIGQLSQIVRTGTPAETIVAVPEHEFWVEFSEASEQTSQLPGRMVADLLALDPELPAEVLDVAAGSGMYGFSVLQRCPKAHVTSLDWQNVLQHARKVAERRGVAERVTWLPGSAFETPLAPAHYDVIIASHFYHHFPAAENIELSARLFAALKPGGRLAVHEWVADEERRERQQALLFAVIMLASTPRGDVYTFAEYRDMLEAVGFAHVTLHEVPMVGSDVILAERPR